MTERLIKHLPTGAGYHQAGAGQQSEDCSACRSFTN